jgi:hypothetical protein
MNCPTISDTRGLRTNVCVPVWQNLQDSVQPTQLAKKTVCAAPPFRGGGQQSSLVCQRAKTVSVSYVTS